MKRKLMVWSTVCATSLAGSLLLGALPAQAGTVANWRFEEGPADAQMVHLSGANGVWSPDVADSSGNGNALSVWTGESWAGYGYRTDVASPTVPQTGEPNHYSVKNTGGLPGMWNNTLEGWTPSAFTVEASFKPEWGGWRTIVGRDSLGAGTQGGADPNASALYFQIQPDNRVAITFEDVMGYQYSAVSDPGLIQGFDYPSDPNGLTGKWYSMAGVSDGSKLSLYLNDVAAGAGYRLVAQTDLTLKGSSNTALTAGTGSGGDWKAGDFSVGRGLYNGGHGDRAYGFIDEVRLSDGALTPDRFLSTAVPEPSTCALLVLGGLSLIRRRRQAAR
ncbi:MAG TPA: PEP-CTERM sorting domain-containing protein [Armatimonadota bacterium]